MSEVLDAALHYAELGFPVFPCRSDKKPYLKGGFKVATTDPDVIHHWWGKQFPDAMIGLPMGEPSGLCAIDIDVHRQDGYRSWKQFRIATDRVATAQTPSGGTHFIFKTGGEPVKTTASVLAPGVDTRGSGGYVVAAPSRPDPAKPGYAWVNDIKLTETAVIPDELVRRLSRDRWSRELDAACDAVRATDEGSRNDTLNAQAFKIGKMIAAGHLKYMAARQALIDAATAAGLPILEAEKTTDSGLTASMGKAGSAEGSRRHDVPVSGRSIAFATPEPWEHAVETGDMLDSVYELVGRYVVLAPAQKTVLAAAVLHFHAFAAADFSPRLNLMSPERRCGKSTFLRVLSRLVPRPLPADSISVAALFRVAEKFHPTVLADEADVYLVGSKSRPSDSDLASLFGSYERGKQVIRTAGEDHEPVAFDVFTPVVIAGIGDLPDILRDRCIVIRMERRLPGDPVERFNPRRADDLDDAHRKLARWAADHVERLADADPDMPDEMNFNHRAQDIYRPLFAICDLAGEEWSSRCRAAAASLLADNADATESQPLRLLKACKAVRAAEVAKANGKEPFRAVSTRHLIDGLSANAEEEWATCSTGGPITERKLASLLKRYAIRPEQIDFPSATGKRNQQRGYAWSAFDQAWQRYTP